MARFVFVFACVITGMLGACTKSHDVLAAGQSLAATPGNTAGSGASGSGAGGSGLGTGIAGTTGGAGTTGSAGGKGSAGTTGGAGGKGSAGSASAACDSCQAGGISGIITLPPCCAKNAAGADVCGLDVSQVLKSASCLERNAPGTADTTCPISTQMMGITLQGCCRPDGTCGSMDTFLGLGCTPNADGTKKACGTWPG